MKSNLHQILYVIAGIIFIITYLLSKNITYILLGVCCFILSIQNKREDR